MNESGPSVGGGGGDGFAWADFVVAREEGRGGGDVVVSSDADEEVGKSVV